MAAAEGWVERLPDSVGGLSFRIGEVFREVCGLAAAGDAVCGAKLLEDVFLSVGVGVGVFEDDVDWDCGFWPFLATVGLEPLLGAGSTVSAFPVKEEKSLSLFAIVFESL